MSEEDLPPGWAIYEDDDGKIFYGNEETGETSETFPTISAAIPSPHPPTRAPPPSVAPPPSGPPSSALPPPPSRPPSMPPPSRPIPSQTSANESRPPPPNRKPSDDDLDYTEYYKEDFATDNPMAKKKDSIRTKPVPPAASPSVSLNNSYHGSTNNPLASHSKPPQSPSLRGVFTGANETPEDTSSGNNVELSSSQSSHLSGVPAHAHPANPKVKDHSPTNPEAYLYEFDDDEENLFEDDARQNKDKFNLPTIVGLSQTVKQRIEIPKEFINHSLLQNETVIGQFDVYFVAPVVSGYRRLLYIFLTFGLFLFYDYFIKPCVRYIRRTFCCLQCDPGLYYNRGKILVTSSGRVLWWSFEVNQSRRFWDFSGVDYKISHKMRTLHVKDLRQISVHYSDTCNGRFSSCACCRAYDAGIDLCFHSFDHSGGLTPLSPYLLTNNTLSYFNTLRSVLSSGGRDIRGIAPSVGGESMDAIATTIRIVSEPGNTCYEGKEGIQPLEDLSLLNSRVLDVLSRSQPNDVFLPASASANADLLKQSSLKTTSPIDEDRASMSAAALNVLDSFTDYQPVTAEGMVTNYSNKWLPLCPGESIVAHYGLFPSVTLAEYLLSVWTFGLFYCLAVIPKKRKHIAYILTTKRIVEIYLQEYHGIVPSSLSNMRMSIRSYWPSNVNSGYLRYRHRSKTMISALHTPEGQIRMELPVDALPFLQKCHLSTSRGVPAALGRDLLQRVNGLYVQSLKDTPTLEPGTVDEEMLIGAGLKPITRGLMKPLDERLLPMFNQETPLYRIQGGEEYLNCCYEPWNLGCAPSRMASQWSLRWNHRIASFLRFCSCGMRPYLIDPAVIVTSHTLLYVDIKKNGALCCPFDNATNAPPFLVVWTPIRSYRDTSLDINAAGMHPIEKFCGCCVCPARAYRAEYVLDIGTSTGVDFMLRGEGGGGSSGYGSTIRAKANWLKDHELQRGHVVMGAMHQIIYEEILSSSKKR